MKKQILRIASRKSPLALCQAELIKQALLDHMPDLTIEIIGMTTEGDRHLDSPLYASGGKGLFLKELEKSLLANETDLAVHSMKDVPADLPDRLKITAIYERDDPADVFISPEHPDLTSLPNNARVGTSSLRRQSQLLAQRPDLDVISLRGNVNSRLKKLEGGEFDAIILAAAGVKRLGLDNHIRQTFHSEKFIPAIGQGALGIETRSDDHSLNTMLQVLEDDATRCCVSAERAINERLGSGCHLPIAAHATLQNGNLHLIAFVGSPDGQRTITVKENGPANAPLDLGYRVADKLLARGAQAIIENL